MKAFAGLRTADLLLRRARDNELAANGQKSASDLGNSSAFSGALADIRAS